MVLVSLQWLKGTQFFDANGDPLAAGTINIYDAGTTDLRTTYSDKDGSVANTLNGSNQIVLDAEGRLDESVYIPIGAWKVTTKDSGGSTVEPTEDNILGALDTSAFTVTSALPSTPVISKTANYTIVDGDRGKVINANPTGGTFVLTLPSASTVGDGWRITIRHVGTANQVTIATVSSQTINGAISRALGSQYESLCLVSDGANWHIDGHAQGFNYGQVPFIYVESRTLTAPPTTPTAGARYIAAGSGTLTGDWSAYSNNDVLESDGQGGWIQLAPVEGWHAYDKGANQMTFYSGSAWVGLPATDDPTASTLGVAVFQDQRSDGTSGGTPTGGSWGVRALSTEVTNTITGCSLSANQVTLPAGDYLIMGHQVFYSTNTTQARLKSTTTATAVTGPVYDIDSANAGTASVGCFGVLSLSAQEIFELQYMIETATATTGLGSPSSFSAGVEIYANLTIIDISSLQGPQGDAGPQGAQGYSGFKYEFSTSTTMTDPGAGVLRLNNGTLSSVTAAVIDATSDETSNPDISDEIAAWDDTGILKIAKIGAEQNWVTYDVTNVVDQTGYLDLTLAYRDHAGSFSNTDAITLQFIPKGEAGATGSSAFVYDYQFNTTTTGDPGSGKILFDNATLSSATAFSISDLDRISTDRSADILAWDDDGASSSRGYLYLINVSTGARVATFKLTGTITDNTTYLTMSATYIAGSAPANNTNVAVLFVPAGATGTIGGSTGATDNALLRADGTVGSTLQNTGITVDDSDNVTMAGALNMVDNTISRPKLIDYGETVNVIGAIGGGSQDIDLTLGNVVTGTVDTSETTFTFSNPSASGTACSFTLILTNGGSQTVNWPASVDWAGGTAPTLTAAGVDVLTFTTVDGGTIWYGFAAGIAMA